MGFHRLEPSGRTFVPRSAEEREDTRFLLRPHTESEAVYQNMPDHEIIRDILAKYWPGLTAESREDAPGVWTHTFTGTFSTAEDMRAFISTVRPHASDPETILVSPETMHELRKAQAQAKRSHRVQLRKRRQRRAAQRKHERGGR